MEYDFLYQMIASSGTTLLPFLRFEELLKPSGKGGGEKESSSEIP